MLALDHALILHADLDAAEAAARRLGFRPTPRGQHGQGMGTANVTIMMPDGTTYFELLGITEPTARNESKRAALDTLGPHLNGVAFKGDAAAEAARFAALGVGEGPSYPFARAVDLPGGVRDARFAVAVMTRDALPPLRCFVCQHFTPEVVWRPDYLDHPNGARSVTGVWGVAADPAALAAPWRRLFGEAVRETAEGISVQAGSAIIRFLLPGAWQARFGTLPDGGTPRVLALEIATGPADAARAALAAGGVVPQALPEGLWVPDTVGFGTGLLLRPS